MWKFLLLLLASGAAFGPVSHPRRSTTLDAVSDDLKAILRKPSKTLAVVLEVEPSPEVATRSMQLRKLGVAALSTACLVTAAELVREQASAKGSFPGPCPVLYTGDEVDKACEIGVSAVVVSGGSSVDNGEVSLLEWDAEMQAVDEESGVVLASVDAMQPENAELQVKGRPGITAVLVRHAIVGDSEDLEYAQFMVDGLTKKRSSTFNMSGLTGSANGHFGGVASSTKKKWLRKQRQQV